MLGRPSHNLVFAVTLVPCVVLLPKPQRIEDAVVGPAIVPEVSLVGGRINWFCPPQPCYAGNLLRGIAYANRRSMLNGGSSRSTKPSTWNRCRDACMLPISSCHIRLVDHKRKHKVTCIRALLSV